MSHSVDVGMRELDGAAAEHVCKRKRSYPSKAIAKEHAAYVTRVYGEKTYAYACPDRGGWHLTSLPPEEFRARQRGVTP